MPIQFGLMLRAQCTRDEDPAARFAEICAQAVADLAEGRFFIGSPDEVTEAIVDICRATGANHLIVSLHGPGMPFAVANDAMRLFAAEVMPRVREAL